MQSLIYTRDPSHSTLGERRGKSDLARFSIDSSWPSAISDTRYWAYPSPPMSGSPPIPPRRNPDFEERSQGSFEGRRQDVSQSGRDSLEGQGDVRGQMQGFRSFPEPYRPVHYPYQQTGRQAGPPQYEQQQPPPQQQQLQPQPPQQQPIAPLQSYSSMHLPQNQPTLQAPPAERPPVETGYQAPKTQRKTKGHVASACVPCKRAHLRCDAQRPCSRCVSNGKEDSCIDVQHKKRGRPRLRDERETRYESFGSTYRPPTQGESSMRRPLSMYSGGADVQTASSYPDVPHRTSSYRVLKSQGDQPSAMARHIEYASMRDVNIYTGGGPSTPATLAVTDSPSAYLTIDLSFVKCTQSFNDAVSPGIAIIGRKLLDLVTDRDKVYRLQQTLEEERREIEPNYLPPIFGRSDEEIQSVVLGMAEVIRANRREMLTFQWPDGQQRPYAVRIDLAKKDSTYFVVLTLPGMSQPPPQPPPQSPYFRQDTQYAYQPPPPQQRFAQTMNPSPSFPYGPPMYQQAGPSPAQIVPRQVPNMATYQPQQAERTDYSQVQAQRPMQIPRSELTQRPQHEPLQLPPIRTQGSSAPGNNNQGRSETGVGRGQEYGAAPDRMNDGGRRY